MNKHYLEKECGINELSSKSYKYFTKYLKQIGRVATLIDLENQFDARKLKPVNNFGEYKKLYRGLSYDEQIFELILDTSNRLFFFIVENFLYIRTIRAKHSEINKVRK